MVDPSRLEVLTQATAIAEEWVTPTRLKHVLDKLDQPGVERTGEVIRAMTEDVLREGQGEIEDSKDAWQAIGRRTAELFRAGLARVLSP